MSENALFRLENLSSSAKPKMRQGTFYVQTWGCQMNEEDSEQISLSLESIGFSPTNTLQEAEVVLLNTCSVRKKPEDKAFSLLGELVPLKQANPAMIIGVCGCMAQVRAQEIKRRAPHVDFVLGTGQISDVAPLVQSVRERRTFASSLALPARVGSVVTDVPRRNVGRGAKLKAFVPIQYGCDKFCTFCIVPTTRGRERSRPTEDIVEEVTELIARGTREITLLGQTVNSYGKNLAEGRVPFSKLLWELNDLQGLKRIRYTSPYPRDFRADLIETIRDCPSVMEHVHLPLQSGDDEVLRSMKRLYTRDSFRQIVRELRQAVPQIAITTDIIIGFPGETDEQFEATLSLVEEIRFDGAYMFVYSPRPGTPAALMEPVPLNVRKDRIHRLVEVQNRICCEINDSYVGRTLEVLVEGPSPKNPERLQGYSREYKMVHFPGCSDLAGQVVNVRAISSHLWGLGGELVS